MISKEEVLQKIIILRDTMNDEFKVNILKDIYNYINQEPQLDSDIEKILNDNAHITRYSKNWKAIKQALVDKDKIIKSQEETIKDVIQERDWTITKLDKIEKYIRTELSYGIVYDTIKQILKEVDNETD